ncbi:MAG: hypothetical protein ISS82_01115 [Nanoarchaeota archaeon]|nr:hypothetical protein [Nanoarchaeota archaeon]
MDLKKYYSRKDIQKAILKISQNREVSVMFNNTFGKRPDTLQFENDILELAKKGATSFHISEEHWTNPLLLKPGMTQKQLNELRTGFDIILDIDGPFEFSTITAELIIEALKFHDVKNISCKFSGNKGWHIGISFKALPNKINNQDIKLLFPETPKVIAEYLKNMIKEPLASKILEKYQIKELEKLVDKNKKLLENNVFNPFSIVDIDTILISNRHLFRAPFSIHEKSSLISIPIKPEDILNFKKEQAKIENIKTDIEFLDDSKVKEGEASNLVIQAFDYYQKTQEKQEVKIKREFEPIKNAIDSKHFPPCITNSLNKGLNDGKKRFLFILINFLKSTGYSIEKITEIINKWNKKNEQPLKQGYIQAQLTWHKKQKENILPPNCSNLNYYKDIGICKPDNWCKFIKNPVNYSTRKIRILKQNKNSD